LAKTIVIIVLGVVAAGLIVGISLQATDLAKCSESLEDLDLEEIEITQPDWEEWASPALLSMAQAFIGRVVFVEKMGIPPATATADEIKEITKTLPSSWKPIEEEGGYKAYISEDKEKIAVPVEDEKGNLAIVSRSVMDTEEEAENFLNKSITDYHDEIKDAGFEVEESHDGTELTVKNEDLNLAIQVQSCVSEEEGGVYVTNIIALTSRLGDLDISQEIFESLH
jgi:hypothetical protein